jgi:integrase
VSTTTKVTVQNKIFKMTDRKTKPHRVAWTLVGQRHYRMFARLEDARDFRNELISAVVRREPFDLTTFLPVVPDDAPAARTITCLALAREIITFAVTSPGRPIPAKSLEAMVVGMATVTQALVTPEATARPSRAELQAALKRHLNPRTKPLRTRKTPEELALRAAVDKAAVTWVERHSLPVAALTTEHMRVALALCGKRLDGRNRAKRSFLRERQELNRLLNEALERGLLKSSPMPWSKRQRGGQSSFRARAVGRDEVPTMAQAKAFVAFVDHTPTRIQLELLRLQGARPGEGAAIQVRDVHLDGREPALEVRRSRTEAPREFTQDGAPFEDKEVKTEHDDNDAVARVVPLFSETIALLRPLMINADGTRRNPNERLCATSTGTPVSSRNRSRSMGLARIKWLASLSADERAEVPAKLFTDAYHLRHAHATALLHSGMPTKEVALRLGHSEQVLLDTYSSVCPAHRTSDTAAADKHISGLDEN